MDMNLEMISSESSWPKLSWVVLGELNTIDFISSYNYHFQKAKSKQCFVCHCKIKLPSTRSINTLFGYKRFKYQRPQCHLWFFECICRLSDKTCLEQSLTQCSSWMILGASTGIVSSASQCVRSSAQASPGTGYSRGDGAKTQARSTFILYSVLASVCLLNTCSALWYKQVCLFYVTHPVLSRLKLFSCCLTFSIIIPDYCG